jgi:hypothetical protein
MQVMSRDNACERTTSHGPLSKSFDAVAIFLETSSYEMLVLLVRHICSRFST